MGAADRRHHRAHPERGRLHGGDHPGWFRGSVDKGQIEAADSLGMSFSTKLRAVSAAADHAGGHPAHRKPADQHVEGTSLVSVLGVADLLQSAQLIYARTYETIPLLIVASLWYLIMTWRWDTPIDDREEVLAGEIPGRQRRRAPIDPLPLGSAADDERQRNRPCRRLRKCYGPPGRTRQHRPGRQGGEIICIIGPSGSGKSTLLRCINGLEEVDRGVLQVNGEDLGFVETDTAYRAAAAKRSLRSAPGWAWSSSRSTSSRT